ncbi:2-oxo-4-hydroxy-4-carboxy-5-ureidoimidazoline decarboxylase [Lacipirellula parvula]|uniref:2-oxo-4-hydroxy-4-carboxy-5-ureidoimidazoline decarboxylase n=1 Tax=Lacipirellula parvula TaxID=2650471 RepID=A0A5K7X787_9BACT|nr:2-oxo-4-hydroxy-4-carboxy-5-ureidoimidazoline decarboxylase [Lacipirellula parvula]BBO32460.1 decarboxylase [Lacipirellula parvula]
MSIAAKLKDLPDEDARAALANCCAAVNWVSGMLAARPFTSDDALFAACDAVAATLTEPDWLEAFAAHPLIGDVDSLRKKYASTKQLAAGEQSGVDAASETTLRELAELNRDYAERFGFIFIVFATGKTADEMLAILKSRIHNSRDQEVANAAAEQLKITRLRLTKLADPKH